ncbi:SapC family protein [Thiocystis violascens]|nr:SapC family protein [Thiocystis violascens]
MTQLTAITSTAFADRNWQRYANYAFASRMNLIPALATELAKLVPALPMGFIPRAERFQLAALTSLQPDSNLFVAPDGRWLAGYVPAALRGYPFALARPEGAPESVLCIDEASGLIVAAGAGEPFFDADGQPAKTVKEVLNFLARVEHDRAVTQTMVDALQAASLIQPWPITVNRDGAAVPVEGIHRVDEAALNALDDAAWLALRRSGALALVYAQLFSMNQLALFEQAGAAQARMRPPPQQPRAPSLQDLGLSFGEEDSLRFDW